MARKLDELASLGEGLAEGGLFDERRTEVVEDDSEAVEQAERSAVEATEEAAKLEAVLKAARSLVAHIFDMADPEGREYWFGPFSEGEQDWEFGTSVEWPNVAIVADDLNKALSAFGREVKS